MEHEQAIGARWAFAVGGLMQPHPGVPEPVRVSRVAGDPGEGAERARLVGLVERMASRDERALAELYDATAGKAFGVTLRHADGTWMPLTPNIAYKMLDDDGSMQAFLLRFDPGARLPAHDHPGDEMCVVLEGSVRLGDVEVSAGDYHMALSRSRHGDLVSDSGAVLFIRTISGVIPHPPIR